MEGFANRARLLIRDLPGVADLEAKLLLYGHDPHITEDLIAKTSRKLFGIADADLARMYELEKEDGEPFLETAYVLADDEAMEALLPLGVDFSDARGQPLRCTKLMAGPAEAAARGLAGKMPDRSDAGLERFEERLVRERDTFLTERRTAGRQAKGR